eukprot:9494202-Pyramimonas_sp.AAC.1
MLVTSKEKLLNSMHDPTLRATAAGQTAFDITRCATHGQSCSNRTGRNIHDYISHSYYPRLERAAAHASNCERAR